MRPARVWPLFAAGLLAVACGDDATEAPTPETPAPAARRAPSNRAPRIERVRLVPEDLKPGGTVTAVVTSADPDGDAVSLTYHWRIDGETYGRGGDAIVLPESAKDARVEVEVSAHDGQIGSSPMSAAAQIGNRAPRMLDIVLEPATELTVESELRASPRGEDDDGDPLDFQFTWFLNGEPMLEEGPTVSGGFHRGDVITLEVVVSDGELESEPLRSPDMQVANSLPRIVSEPVGVDDQGVFRYSVAVEDPDGDRRLRYKLRQAPEGMSLDWLSGSLSWKPSDEQAGEHPVEIEVDDQEGGITSQSFVVEVGFEEPEEQTPPAAAADPEL